ncbi:MAG TPA: deoxyribonuclease V [Bdellovibrionota bacterium]|nr:deoxyribonuclease V [Bdellovibrionota bacterium]
MEHRDLHRWDLTPSEAFALQLELARGLRIEKLPSSIRLVAGADLSYERFSDLAHAAFVVLEFPSLRIVERAGATARMTFPYIPGLLTFREGPALLAAWRELKTRPDVVVFDGQGIAHPRRLGIAAHMGLWIGIPSVGCGKTKLAGSFEEPGPMAGDFSPMIHRGEVIGSALRTRTKAGPVFVSPGHLADLEGSRELAMRCSIGYRVPEPTRQAHLLANELRVAARAA